MRILFVHQHFPGQFETIARHFLASGEHEICALYREGGDPGRNSSSSIDGIRTLPYGSEVTADRPPEHVLSGTDRFIREAASAAIVAEGLKREGWYPDLVYSHTGWGTGAFLHDIFPSARFVKYCEWFYNNNPESTEFLKNDRPFEARIMTSLFNIPVLSDLMRADLLISPTAWQRSQFPAHVRGSIEIVPDGINTDVVKPDAKATFSLGGGKSYRAGDRVITYVARGADPFRGFKQFMEALAIVQSRDQDVEAIIVGDRKVYYGSGHGTEAHFHDVMRTTKIDLRRTHFVGRLDYPTYLRVLQVSAAHVYLTVPFVLSWSALEALASGCALIGSDTAPVREFIDHEQNGLLAGFFDPEAIAAQVEAALAGGPKIKMLREKARSTIESRWNLELAVRRHQDLISRLL